MNIKISSHLPLDKDYFKQTVNRLKINDLKTASIREIKRLADTIQEESHIPFIRMEMGIPGIPPSAIGVSAEIEALQNGVAGVYPDIDGIPELKSEISKFCKLFLNLDVPPHCSVPSVGSMHGSLAAFLVSLRRYKEKNCALFIDPGFPVHKQMIKMLGFKQKNIDIYSHRGTKLRDALITILKEGDIGAILYSNPNNPSWICFTEEELKIIGELSIEYDFIVIEDLAYFAMDFRSNLSIPGIPPYQPSVAKFTPNYVILISSSKIFSYAGQRIGMMIISPNLNDSSFENLNNYFPTTFFGHSIIYGALYASTSGAAHSSQYALTAILKAVNNGQYNFINNLKEYGEKAKIMKEILLKNNFKIVYDFDGDKLIADGFYFTFSYPNLKKDLNLVEELFYYGISTLGLFTTGSTRSEGVRACVSLIQHNHLPLFAERIERFHLDHP